ncbi:MAG: zf-HC2 domain-containing protein [Clostridia bacterium]|nr:zf-HC2 domain-containing protein [Clostridia bacterium]
MKCEIIKDLLPSYIDGLTSAESNFEIEKHLKDCSQCQVFLEQMKADVNVEDTEYNKEEIKPFKKFNKKILHAVLITLTVCALAVGAYLFFFGFGWKVNSDDMNMEYTYKNGKLQFEFELTNGRVLNAWTDFRWTDSKGSEYTIKFTECFSSVLDDRGKHPNQYSYGIKKMGGFDNDDYLILQFKDKTKTICLKEIVEELSLQ